MVWCSIGIRFLDKCCGSGSPKYPRIGVPSAQGIPVASQPASQHQPTPSQPSRQPARCHPVCEQRSPELLQASIIPFQSSKTFENHWFLFVFCYVRLVACQYSNLEAPKVTPNIPIWIHGAQSEPTVSPGAPKIHQRFIKCSQSEAGR